MKRKLLIVLLCVLALCWLCVGVLAVGEPSESVKPINIFDSAEVDWEGNPITVQIYPSYSGYVTFRDGNLPTCTAIAATNYVFAGYRVRDLNDPISVGTSDSYSQFGTAVESIGTMPNMEHPIFTAIFERVNVAVSPVGAGSASYTALDDFKGFVAEPNEGWRFFGWKYAADAWIEPAEYNSTDTYISTDTMWEMSNPRRTGTYTAYFVKMAEYMLSPAAFTLTKSGYTDIPVELTWLVLGKVWDFDTEKYYQAEGITFTLHGGTLTDAAGNSILFQVADENHAAHGNGAFLYTWHTSQGETDIMPVWIDDNDFEQAEPGTYTGTLTYDAKWKCYDGTKYIAYPYGSRQIALTLVVPEHVHAITTDGAAQAYYYNDSFEQVFPTEAAEGTALSLTLDDSAVPETGYYFTGEFTLNGVSLGRETSEDGLTSWPVTGFTMPAQAVTIGAVQAERETLALSFAPGETRALPMDAWMQLQYYETAVGEPPLLRYDEAAGTEALDVNRDGKPDLQIAFDDEAYCVNLTRMPACAAFGAFSFAFSGPTDRYGTVAFTLPAPAFGPAAFTLPAALTTIEESAFEGNAAMTIVDANHVTAIGANAFKGCANLTQIRLPADCAIHAAAFTGCGTVLVFAPSGGSTEAACETMENCVFCAFNN